jgi:hypothetical protein
MTLSIGERNSSISKSGGNDVAVLLLVSFIKKITHGNNPEKNAANP